MLVMRVEGVNVRVPVLVTPQLDDLILGLRWIQDWISNWNFKEGCVELSGKRVKVHVRTELGRCRRVVAAVDKIIPPFSECEVDVYAILPNLQSNVGSWATKARALDTGLLVAGSLLPPRAVDLTLRVLNPTDKAIRLRRGARCDAEDVVVREGVGAGNGVVRCNNTCVAEAADLEEVLEPLWEEISSDVPATVQQQLRDLVLEHKKAFSLGEWDLGNTDLLQHEIETGTEAPVRQALRRQPLLQLPIID